MQLGLQGRIGVKTWEELHALEAAFTRATRDHHA
jgi:hypothetical protein